jgi:nicotinamide mononucleotide transporter
MVHIMPLNTWIEIFATASTLIFIFFMIKENIICWPFGIVGSLLSVYLFADAKLYSESILYFFYVVMGVWGWVHWYKKSAHNDNFISKGSWNFHLSIFIISSCFALALGYGFDTYSDAQRPYLDAFTTAFSFAATYMEIKKVLETWFYWFVINLISIWLYHDRALDIYAALIGVYSIMSVWGFITWRKAFQLQPSNNSTATN